MIDKLLLSIYIMSILLLVIAFLAGSLLSSSSININAETTTSSFNIGKTIGQTGVSLTSAKLQQICILVDQYPFGDWCNNLLTGYRVGLSSIDNNNTNTNTNNNN